MKDSLFYRDPFYPSVLVCFFLVI